MNNILALSLALFIAKASHAAMEKSRPMSEMHGDCANYQMDLKKELELWEKEARPVASAKSIPLGQRLDLRLTEQSKVSFTVKPEKASPPKEKTFAGVFKVRPDFDGTLRAAAGGKLWFDLVDAGAKAAVPSAAFEMQTKCAKILKVVEFPVRKGVEYALQISGSKSESAAFLLTRP